VRRQSQTTPRSIRTGINPSYWATLIATLADISNRLSSTLIRLYRYWDIVTTGGIGDTDGFIQFGSQGYPNSPGAHVPDRYVIRGADSHTGSTASPMVRDGLDLILTDRMGVLRPE
jgi:hypothetical protein